MLGGSNDVFNVASKFNGCAIVHSSKDPYNICAPALLGWWSASIYFWADPTIVIFRRQKHEFRDGDALCEAAPSRSRPIFERSTKLSRAKPYSLGGTWRRGHRASRHCAARRCGSSERPTLGWYMGCESVGRRHRVQQSNNSPDRSYQRRWQFSTCPAVKSI